MDLKLNTLQYLTEPSFLEKINRNDKKFTLDDDIDFYKKRIYLTTKSLLRNKNINPSVNNAFNEYAITLIKYFKITDTNDILQEELKHMKQNNNTPQELNKDVEDEANAFIMNNINDECDNGTLKNFVKIIKTGSPEKIFMPEKKRINLKDPNLKNKGIYDKKRK
jgi:hypothetical protein